MPETVFDNLNQKIRTKEKIDRLKRQVGFMGIGKNFRNKRKMLNLTLEQLAEKVGTNITTLSMFERDSVNISMHTLLDLCTFFDLNLLDALEIKGENSFLKYIKTQENIGEILLLCRTTEGLSRYRVAELSQLSEVTISLVEKGILIPTLDTFTRLAKVYLKDNTI